MHPYRSLLSVLAFLLPTAASHADVLIVDKNDGPGTDYLVLQDALNAAADGDVVLLRDGTYDGATFIGKGLTIAADEGASPLVRGDIYNPPGLYFWGVPATSSVVIRGLRLRGAPGVWAWGNEGSILLDSCEIEGRKVVLPSLLPAIEIYDSDVVVTNCELFGAIAGAQNSAALFVEEGSAHVFDSTLLGGGWGGAGLEARGDSFVYVAGGWVQGGAGIDAHVDGGECHTGTQGGAGLRSSSTSFGSPEVVTRDAAIHAGPGGAPLPTCAGGSPGVVFDIVGGTHTALEGASHGLVTESPVQSGSTATLKVYGAPGQLAFVAVSGSTAAVWLGDALGTLAIGPAPWIPAGTIGADGSLRLSGPVALPAGLPHLTLVAQAALVDAGTVGLSAPTALAIVASN